MDYQSIQDSMDYVSWRDSQAFSRASSKTNDILQVYIDPDNEDFKMGEALQNIVRLIDSWSGYGIEFNSWYASNLGAQATREFFTSEIAGFRGEEVDSPARWWAKYEPHKWNMLGVEWLGYHEHIPSTGDRLTLLYEDSGEYVEVWHWAAGDTDDWDMDAVSYEIKEREYIFAEDEGIQMVLIILERKPFDDIRTRFHLTQKERKEKFHDRISKIRAEVNKTMDEDARLTQNDAMAELIMKEREAKKKIV